MPSGGRLASLDAFRGPTAERTAVAADSNRPASFALGIVLNGVGEFEWATLRVPGVLQRIAVSYLVAAVVSLTTGWRPQALTASCGDLYFLSSLVAR
jgi:predicted acyltransferase